LKTRAKIHLAVKRKIKRHHTNKKTMSSSVIGWTLLAAIAFVNALTVAGFVFIVVMCVARRAVIQTYWKAGTTSLATILQIGSEVAKQVANDIEEESKRFHASIINAVGVIKWSPPVGGVTPDECDSGYTNIGLLCYKPLKCDCDNGCSGGDVYPRPWSCGAGQDQVGLLCYDKCGTDPNVHWERFPKQLTLGVPVFCVATDSYDKSNSRVEIYDPENDDTFYLTYDEFYMKNCQNL
jgi:hypothetical protein